MSQKIATTFSILILVVLLIIMLSALTALPLPSPRSSNNYALPFIVYQPEQMAPQKAHLDSSPAQIIDEKPETLISLASFTD